VTTTVHVDEDELWCEALADLSGEVVELGCGDGRNFARYPSAVTGVHALDPDPSQRHRARGVAAWVATPVWVRDDPVEALPLDTASIDGGVLHLLLTRRSDPAGIVAELARVIRTGGRLVILEHADPDDPGPLAVVRAGGFVVDTWRAVQQAGPRVVGRARRVAR
jgi:SAM-dependent methyltransferase